MTSLGFQVLLLTLITLCLLIGIAWYANRKNVGADANDFFSAGKSLGFIVVTLSVFADSYSGNSFLGYAAQTYRSGAWFLAYPQFMVAGIIGALIIAPPLINLARKWGYTSPIDFVEHRFNSKVAFLVLLLMIWGTFVQFTEQFLAMGYLGRVASGGVMPYEAVVLLFAVVILIYVGLGGFRGTALSAALQGGMMLMSISLMLLLIGQFGGVEEQIESVWQHAPEKMLLPDSSTMGRWYGIVILILFGLPTYMHIQQFYLGVKDSRSLRTTFRLQAPIFLFASFILWMIGLFGAGVFPALSEAESENLIPLFMDGYVQSSGQTLVPSLISLGIIMATLSTAGATVMVLSMGIAKDMYRRFINADASDRRVIQMSRVSLGLLIVFAVAISFAPNLTIWGWTQIKFEFLLQATPVFVFGFYLHWLKSRFVIAGIVSGCITALGIYFLGTGSVYGLPAGIIGLAVNSMVLLLGSYFSGEDSETGRAREILYYNSVESLDGDEEVRYVLPSQTASFWIGLAILLALMVPWYAPESWNAQAALGLPIWVWVTAGMLVLEAAFVLYGTTLWRRK